MKRKNLFSVALGVLCFCAATASWALSLVPPLRDVVIMLDPGHGGSDSGAIGSGGLKESQTNLRVAKYLGMLLKADGAKVLMTRDSDLTLSLQERVDKAREMKPDLFISIHHNASLKPKKEHPGEIYFNALDKGIPLEVADQMARAIRNNPLASGSLTIPGGFFVLRNNSAPAVLTEASYISVPENEKALRTGRSLTNEAQALRLAIRKVFTGTLLKVQVLSKQPCQVSTPYFNILLSANKPIRQVELDMRGPGKTSFRLEKIPSFRNIYSLGNLSPLPSGDYAVSLHFQDLEGKPAQTQKLTIEMRTPVANSVLMPIAPYIPRGYKGGFPLRLVLKDADGRVNQRILPFQVKWGTDSVPATTVTNGQAGVLIDLRGNEEGSLRVEAVGDEGVLAQTDIPVLDLPSKTCILGKVVSSVTGVGLEKVRVNYGPKRMAITGPGGYFFCELSKVFGNLTVKLSPPLGYSEKTEILHTGGKRVSNANISCFPISPALLSRQIALMSQGVSDRNVRWLVRNLMLKGVIIRRLFPWSNERFPESKAVAQANSMEKVSLFLSLKMGSGNSVSLRHYYKSKAGTALCEEISKRCRALNLKVKSEDGSDYELAHTGATAVAVEFPKTLSEGNSRQVLECMVQALQAGF